MLMVPFPPPPEATREPQATRPAVDALLAGHAPVSLAPPSATMGQVFLRRTTAALLFLIAALSIACVALLVLLLAPDWRDAGGHASGGAGPTASTAGASSLRPRPSGTPAPPPRTTPRPPPATSPSATTQAPKEPWEREYRIPRATLPHHYDLFLHPDLQSGRFSGRVAILVGVTAPMDFLVAHVKQMNVTKTDLVDASTGDRLALRGAFEYQPNQFWVVRPRASLRPGNYTLHLEFEGALDGSIVGLYRSVYTNKDGEKR